MNGEEEQVEVDKRRLCERERERKRVDFLQ